MKVNFVDLSNNSEAGAPSNIAVLQDVSRKLRLDYAVCGAIFPGIDKIFAFSTFPKEWMQHYAAEGFFEIDPYLETARQTASPFDWSRIRSHPNWDRFHEIAEAHGMPRNGASFPVHSPDGSFSILSIAKHCTDSEWGRHIAPRYPDVMVLAVQFHETLRRIVLQDHQEPRNLPAPYLDGNEIQLLEALQDSGDIAIACRSTGMSKRNAETYLKSAKMKLDALTQEHAVVRARALGLIEA